MTSFRLGIKPSKKAAGRFISRARRKLQQAMIRSEAQGVKQADVAREIGVHRSVVNRELRGEANITLGRFAELAHAMGGEAQIDICFPEDEAGRNAPVSSSAHIASLSVGSQVRSTGAMYVTRTKAQIDA